MTQRRKRSAKGYRSRQERALAQRDQELTRYGEGDFLDNRGASLVKASNAEGRRAKRKAKKVKAAADIERLEEKLK